MRLLFISLPLLSLSCLQTIDQASQESRNAGPNFYLSLANQKAYIGDDDKTGYDAKITALQLAERKNFGKTVSLKANTDLHDAGPLRITTVKFSFSTSGRNYDCVLTNKDGIAIKQKIKFSPIEHCPSGNFVYSNYMLKNGNDTIAVVAKIEMKDGIPRHLYLRHLERTIAADSFEYTMKLTKNNSTPVTYVGKSGDEEYSVTLNATELPSLALNYDGKNYTEEHKREQKDTDYDGLTVAELETEDNSYFNNKCQNSTSLRNTNRKSLPINGREHKLNGQNVLRFSDDNRCEHYIYGLNDPAVVKYLKRCVAKCQADEMLSSDPDKSTNKDVFSVELKYGDEKRMSILLFCKEDNAMFYLGKGHLSNRLYVTTSQSTLWYDCEAGKHGKLQPDGMATSRSSSPSSSGKVKEVTAPEDKIEGQTETI